MIIIQNFGFANWLFHCDFHAGADAVYSLYVDAAYAFAHCLDLSACAYGSGGLVIGPVAQLRRVSFGQKFHVFHDLGHSCLHFVCLAFFECDLRLRQLQRLWIGTVHFAEVSCDEVSCVGRGDVDELAVFLLLSNYVELICDLLLQTLYCICLILSQISLP